MPRVHPRFETGNPKHVLRYFQDVLDPIHDEAMAQGNLFQQRLCPAPNPERRTLQSPALGGTKPINFSSGRPGLPHPLSKLLWRPAVAQSSRPYKRAT